MHRSNRLAENQSFPGKTKFLTVTIRTIATAVILMGIDSPLILTFIAKNRCEALSIGFRALRIRGIKTMVQESRPCPDVLVQIAAGALDRVARMVLDEHLTECIARAAEEEILTLK